MTHYCYLIINENSHTYIGITNNLDHRIEQHNGIRSGGAKATKKSKAWRYKCIIECIDEKAAKSIEYNWKCKKTSNGKRVRTYGLQNRMEYLKYILEEYKEKIEKHTIYNY